MAELSDAQFTGLAKELNEPESGFSVKVSTGRRPRSGYMVSLAGGERKASVPVTGDDLKDYAKRHEADLKQPDKYLGGWHPEPEPDKPDTAALDTSIRFPRRSRRRAAAEMVMNNQDAMYSVHEGKDFNNVMRGPTPSWVEPGMEEHHRAAMDAANAFLIHAYRTQAGRPSLESEARRRQAK